MTRRRRRKSPRKFLIVALAAAIGAGGLAALFSIPEERPQVKTNVTVEQPYQDRAEAPRAPAPQAPQPETQFPPSTLPPRMLDPTPIPRSHPPQKPRGLARKGITILQIGDSHTAADFMTGELRRILQARYGDGGAGYMSAGRPHIGVRSSAFTIKASEGWTYESLQQSSDAAKFWLTGFNAAANTAGETISFSAAKPFNFDRIEIQAMRVPDGGMIEIRLDGVLQSEVELKSETREPVVIHMMPEQAATDRVREISITTKGEGSVQLSSVAVFNRQFGLSYNSVGFPGATVDIVNKFDEVILENELKRLDPQIVVLAFGTNEGFNDGLDPERYAQAYERALGKIRLALPEARIVVLAPPDAARGPKKQDGDNGKDKEQKAAIAAPAKDGECGQWRRPPMLDRVREIQEQIAKRRGLVYWSWASIMPPECGADRWANASPPLVARDRVHFTLDGYRYTAAEFVKVLLPVIEQIRKSGDVVSNH